MLLGMTGCVSPILYFFIYALRLIIDPVYTFILGLIPVNSDKKHDIWHGILDLYVLGMGIIGVTIYTSDTICLLAGPFFAWRLITIFLIRLNELSFIKWDKPTMESLPRTIFWGLFNLFEVTLAYSFFYSQIDTLIFTGDKMNVILNTLKMYIAWGLPDGKTACPAQGWLVLSQILFAIVFLLFFVGNISSFKYKKR